MFCFEIKLLNNLDTLKHLIFNSFNKIITYNLGCYYYGSLLIFSGIDNANEC